MRNQYFEVVLYGFTDDTDNLIKWIEAPSIASAKALCDREGWHYKLLLPLNLPHDIIQYGQIDARWSTHND